MTHVDMHICTTDTSHIQKSIYKKIREKRCQKNSEILLQIKPKKRLFFENMQGKNTDSKYKENQYEEKRGKKQKNLGEPNRVKPAVPTRKDNYDILPSLRVRLWSLQISKFLSLYIYLYSIIEKMGQFRSPFFT